MARCGRPPPRGRWVTPSPPLALNTMGHSSHRSHTGRAGMERSTRFPGGDTSGPEPRAWHLPARQRGGEPPSAPRLPQCHVTSYSVPTLPHRCLTQCPIAAPLLPHRPPHRCPTCCPVTAPRLPRVPPSHDAITAPSLPHKQPHGCPTAPHPFPIAPTPDTKSHHHPREPCALPPGAAHPVPHHTRGAGEAAACAKPVTLNTPLWRY